MLRIGLTGGIGSGKTTVADYFSSLAIDVIDADEIVHKISVPGQKSFDTITEHFGEDIHNADGTINRQALAKKVFKNETARKKLEAILHPEVRDAMKLAIQEVRSPYCILVIPLLVETSFTELVDRVLVVTADREKRVAWIKQRNGLSDDQIESIMAAQASDEERIKIADDIIENNGSQNALFHKVRKLDEKYRAGSLLD
ncbi:MAG TPA: dephospho-CoA kinase [Gammaproteobacteria bacterium]|nr:dephospho-CoA kinase [Gammaproteobacteria bacterium]